MSDKDNKNTTSKRAKETNAGSKTSSNDGSSSIASEIKDNHSIRESVKSIKKKETERGFRRVILIKDEEGVTRLKGIEWLTALYPLDGRKQLSYSDKGITILRAGLKGSDARAELANCLQDIDKLRDILMNAMGSKNGYAQRNVVSTSISSMYNAIRSSKITTHRKTQNMLCVLLTNILRSMGQLSHDMDHKNLDIEEIHVESSFMEEAMSSYFIDRAIGLLPEGSGIKTDKYSILELAGDIVFSHSKFVSQLLMFDTFNRDITSFMTRLNYYLRDEALKVIGDDAQLFIENSNFRTLASNISLMKMALDLKYSNIGSNSEGESSALINRVSSPVLWALEDERLLNVLKDIEKMGYFRVITRSDITRSFEIDEVQSASTGLRTHILVKKVTDYPKDVKGFRSFAMGGGFKYFFDNRLDQLALGIGLFNNIDPWKTYCNFAYSTFEDENLTSIYNDVTAYDQFLLASASTGKIYLDVLADGRTKWYYQLNHDVNDNTIKLYKVLGKECITDNEHIAIFGNCKVQKATSALLKKSYVTSFDSSSRYEGYEDLLFNPFDKTLRVDMMIEKNNVVLTADIRREIVSTSQGSFVMNIPEYTRSVLDDLYMLLDSVALDEFTERRFSRDIVELIKPIFSGLKSFDYILLNYLWNNADNSQFITKSIHSNADSRVEIRLGVLSIFLNLLGYDYKRLYDILSKEKVYLHGAL